MMIHLPKDVESSINAEVLSGHFASADEAIAEAWRKYLERRQEQARATGQAASGQAAATAHKPIWEVIEDENASIPSEVWDALPADLSEQRDHYIYGTPKRSAE